MGIFFYTNKQEHVCPQPQIIRETIQVPAPQSQPISQNYPSNSLMNRQYYLEGYNDGLYGRRPCNNNYYYMRGYQDGRCHHDNNHRPGIDIHLP